DVESYRGEFPGLLPVLDQSYLPSHMIISSLNLAARARIIAPTAHRNLPSLPAPTTLVLIEMNSSIVGSNLVRFSSTVVIRESKETRVPRISSMAAYCCFRPSEAEVSSRRIISC